MSAQPLPYAVFRQALEAYTGVAVDEVDELGPPPAHIAEFDGWADNSDLSAGLSAHWFEWLTPDQKDACLAEMLDAVADLADAGRPDWLRIVAACARSGAPGAEDICRRWSQCSSKYSAAHFDTAYRSFC
jgi:hypothetical protein